MGINYDHLRGLDEVKDGFTVRCFATPCEDNPGDCFGYEPADQAALLRKIETGELDWFDAKVEASLNGVVLGADYLGQCCYANREEFFTEEAGYAEDMRATAIATAKVTLEGLLKAWEGQAHA